MISSFFVYNYFPYKEFKEKNLSYEYLTSPIKESYTLTKGRNGNNTNAVRFFLPSSTVRLPFIFSADDYTNRFQSFCEQAFSKK